MKVMQWQCLEGEAPSKQQDIIPLQARWINIMKHSRHH